MADNDTKSVKTELPSDVAEAFNEYCDRRVETKASVVRRLILEELADSSLLESERKKVLFRVE